jgi:hypothetical protein
VINDVTRGRNHTAIVLAVWTIWPAALGVLSLRNGVALAAAWHLGSAVAALGAAMLAVSAHRGAQTAGVAILLVVWLPWIVRMVEGFSLSFGPRLMAVAESPLAFLATVILESFFVVPLPVFAISVWKRRDE